MLKKKCFQRTLAATLATVILSLPLATQALAAPLSLGNEVDGTNAVQLSGHYGRHRPHHSYGPYHRPRNRHVIIHDRGRCHGHNSDRDFITGAIIGAIIGATTAKNNR